MLGFLRSNRHERPGFLLYGAAVAAARDPFFYLELGVADTLDGRFDLIGLYVFLLIRRLRADMAPGPALAQAVFDAMFSDMDLNLREMGVGDLGLSRRIRMMWEAFHGRAAAYEAAFGDEAVLAQSLERNVWRRAIPEGAREAGILARIARGQSAHLDRQPLARLAAGIADFLPARSAAA